MLHSSVRHARRVAAAGSSVLLALTLLATNLGMAPARRIADPDSLPRKDSVQVDVSHLLGASGKLRAIQVTPERLANDSLLATLFDRLRIDGPGIHAGDLRSPDGTPVVLVALIPFEEKTGSTLQGYRVGFWPRERRPSVVTALPEGFIEVTEATQDVSLSQHFRVRDFVTKDQWSVWPKYLLVQPALLDKLELIVAELEEMGKPAAVKVLSGFRTPQYNQRGVCRRCGRARDSRHMYGDAADIFIDADGNGTMDDLNGDGRITTADAQFLARIVERVEAAHPELVGGIGIYRARRGHGPFLHVDARGHSARW